MKKTSPISAVHIFHAKSLFAKKRRGEGSIARPRGDNSRDVKELDRLIRSIIIAEKIAGRLDLSVLRYLLGMANIEYCDLIEGRLNENDSHAS